MVEAIRHEYTPEEIKRKLGGFTGTTCYYLFNGLRVTDGIKFLAEKCECYWLLELICINSRDLVEQHLQVWKLIVKDGIGILICSDGNYNKLFEMKIRTTDFPLDKIEIWLQRGVLLLPSEY